MTDTLAKWIEENKLIISESKLNNCDIISIEGIGDFLYLHSFEGKIIDEDFSFILSDEEFDILDEKKVNFVLFEFGTKFYYSGLKQDKNKYNEIIYKPEFNDFKYLGKTSEPFIMDFAHIGIHTEYEIMNGSGSPELWIKKGSFLGCKALGICDKNSMAGTLSFQTFCEKKGIKSVIGETISVAKEYSEGKQNQETFELKMYILNYQGWKNLLLINKAINVDYNGFIPDTLLYTLGKGLCCVVPKESELNYIKDNRKEVIKLITKYNKSFDKVYYQIDTVKFTSKQLFKKHLENINTYLCNYRKLLKPILINDSYYLDKEESELKTLLNKINKKVSPESEDQYFKSVGDTINSYSEWIEDVKPLFEVITTGILNASELVDDIKFRINTGERKLPHFEVKNVEELFFKELEKGVNERLADLDPKELEIYLKRIETECNVIVPNGLCDYFMILWDVVQWCKKNDINVGTGRGSVCGSLVAYCLYITDVNPLKYDLLFERFLNETRVSGERSKSADSMPDIDIDFPTQYRDDVKNYIKEKYGYDYTCSIGTYTRMKLKTCIKDFGKEKGLSFDYTNKLTKDIDDQIEYTWGDLIEYATKSKSLFKFVQEYPDIVHLTKYALLLPKSESVHPSAVVIVPKFRIDESHADINLWEWMPIKKIDGVLVSEWEGKYIDKSGFLKEDILGLSQLDKFKSILTLIKKNTGKNIDVNKIPLDDESTFRYFKRGWNEDVFQFGTTGLMNYCRQVKPDTLEELIAMTALFRPGPMEINAHADFADIKNGKKKPSYDFGMEEITKETFSLYVYQEQIMKAVVVGGLTEVESDILRTTIKKKDVKTLSSFGEKFQMGYSKFLENNGIEKPKEYANKVWNKLLAFSGYGFNKSHATAYSIMSYWSQWFKVNYPLEFWTTALQFSKESEVTYRLAELKKTGVEIEIRPPDINFSDINFTCDPKEQRIFFSLMKIKGVGEIGVQNIINTRNEGGQFYSLEEFLSRVPSKVNKTVVKCLIIAGAFDLLENITNPRDRRKLLVKYLDMKGDVMPEEYNVEDAKTNAFWILEQKRLTGFGEVDYENMIRESIPNKRIAKIYINDSEFLITKEKTEVAVAGKLIYYKEKEIKSGTMCTLNIDCNNTIIPVLMWPDAFEKIGEEISNLKGCIIAVNGIVKNDKFKNEKKIISNNRTKLYVISDHKNKIDNFLRSEK
jgi:DNA polymerase-3 subunit alpha